MTERRGFDAGVRQGRDGGVQFVGMTRHDPQSRPRLAERTGHLQAEPARAAGDQCRAAGEIEQLLHRPAHVSTP